MAELALLLNPHRDLIDGDQNKVYKRLLYILIRDGQFDEAQWLIDNGADINALQRPFLDDTPEWPILYCTLIDSKASDFLIDNGADLDCLIRTEEHGDQPLLFEMLSSNSTHLAEYLIRKGANVNARNRSGLLILTTLLMNEKLEAAKFLVSHGGTIDPEDLTLETSSGSTVEEYLQTNKCAELFRNHKR